MAEIDGGKDTPLFQLDFPGLVIANVVFTGARLGNGADATVFEVDWNGTPCATKRLATSNPVRRPCSQPAE